MELRGRSLWLIGASSGIGAALAPALAAEGCLLAISARRAPELLRVAGEASLRGPQPLVKPLDVKDLDAMQRTYAELKQAWGRVEVMFYNAGTGMDASVENFDTRAALDLMDVNLLGLVRAVGTVMPDMITDRAGEIIGMASIAGYAGMPKSSSYSASKAAEIAFLQSLRIDLRRHGIGVTTVNPGWIRTPLTEHSRSRMPFIISAEEAARRIVEGMLKGEPEIHFPKRLSWPAKLFTALPRPIYETIARRTAGH